MDALMKLSVIIQTVDKLTSPVGKMIKSVTNLENIAAKGKGLSEFGQRTMVTGVMLQDGAEKLKGMTASILQPAMNFEQGLANIKASTGATAEEMKNFRQLALDMGAKTKYSAAEAAQGIEALAKAGVSMTDIMNGGLEGALNMAIAGELDLGEASDIAATALNTFKSDALSVTQAADILAGAANASATDIRGLQFGLSAVGSVAAGVGLSFNDTATSLAVFAQNGLKGSDAGTSLKTMLMNLQPSTKAQREEFKKLGLVAADGSSLFYDSAGHLKSMADIANILQSSLKGMTDAQRSASLEIMFGSDAIRAGNILFKEGASGIKKMNAEMLKVSAADVVKTKMDTLGGQIEELRGQIETIVIGIGEKLIPSLKELLPSISKIIQGLGKFAETHPRLTKTTVLILAIMAGLFSLLAPIVTVVGMFATGTGAIIQGIGKTGKALMWLKPQIISAYETLYLRALYARDGINSAGTAVKNFGVRLLDLGKGGVTKSVEVIKRLGGAVVSFGRQAFMTAVTKMPALIASVWSFTAALLANPITWIIAAVMGLCVGLFFLVKNWDKVKAATISTWNKVVYGTKVAFAYLRNIFTRFGPTILATLFPGLNIALSLFKNLRKIFKSSGSGLLRAFTEGLKSMLLLPYNVLKGGLARIRRLLPHSDAKEGPLSTLTKSGGALVNTFGTGMVKKLPGLKNSLASGLAAMSLVIPTPGIDTPTLSGTDNSGIVGIEQSETKSTVFTKSGSKKKEIHIQGGVHIHVEKMDSVEDFFKVIKDLADEVGGDEEDSDE